MISRIAKISQSNEEDDVPAEAQILGSMLFGLGKHAGKELANNVKNKVFSGIGKAYNGVSKFYRGINKLFGGGLSDEMELLNHAAKVSQSDDDTPAEAQLSILLSPFGNKEIISRMYPQQDNGAKKNALIEDDGIAEAENDALVQAFLEKLMAGLLARE